MADRLRVSLPVIVEGKYDKNTLLQIIDACVITTGGFSVFNSKEKQALIRRIGEKGVIILTDSDGGGVQIRKFLQQVLPADKVHNLYVPRVEGKEKRKTKPSKSGTLGVEGMKREVLERIFAPFADNRGRVEKNLDKDAKMITKLDFFEDGLSGGREASSRRDRLAEYFSLPPAMSASALIEALNLLSSYGEYKKAVSELFA